jgi:hypothetical protein
MKNSLFTLLILSVVIACDNDKDSPSKLNLLTAGSQKGWYPYDATGFDLCPSNADDTWIFFADGTFELDNGDINESEAESCSDLVSLIGEWEFQNGESEIEVEALQEKDDPTNTFSFIILDGNIKTLTEDKLVIEAEDGDESIEFRKR